MSDFTDIRKKKLFARWNRISKDLSKMVIEIDRENAEAVLEELGYILMSYPNLGEFLIEYETYLFDKHKKTNKSIDKTAKESETKDNVVNIFDFKNKDKDQE